MLVVITAVVSAATLLANDRSGKNSFKTSLDGYHEVPAVSSTGSGEFELRVVDDNTLEYQLRYENLEGTTTTASHVHFGQKSVNGGVLFFVCGGGGRPPCTPAAGSFTGFVTAADIVGPTAQGIAAGEFAEALKAIRAGNTYINVHTNKHPGGEIRGQINGTGGED